MNVDTLVAAMPGLSRTKANQYVTYCNNAMREFGITTNLRAFMWLAQVGHESVSLMYFEEIASGAAYEGRRDLGNTHTGDGKRFKGRGPIQITGRANYTAAASALKLDLVNNPALAARPEHAFRVSAWWWKTHGLNEISDRGDVTAATRRINGGLNGLADRQSRYSRVKRLGSAVLPAGAPKVDVPTLHVAYFSRSRNRKHADVKVWQQKMKSRGWTITADQDFGPKSETVCKQFQRQKGLKADGIVGPVTWQTTWVSPIT
jgi:predicted chitinase